MNSNLPVPLEPDVYEKRAEVRRGIKRLVSRKVTPLYHIGSKGQHVSTFKQLKRLDDLYTQKIKLMENNPPPNGDGPKTGVKSRQEKSRA